MSEPQYSLLADIQYDTELARQGKFALYGQRNIAREYRCKKATPEEQQACETLQNVLFMVPQWSDTEELHSAMERIGGPMFWTRISPRRCVKALLVRHSSSSQSACRNGAFR